jgi:tetratricopeptide (TPR) repeat protein
MEDVKFESVRQVEDLYEKLIDIYNEVGAEYEELEAIDDDIQEIRNTTLDKYDYSLMAEVYRSLGENDTADELDEKANECEEVIVDLQKKLEGVDIKEHLFKFYEMEIRKENFDIQMKACEKFLEKSQRKRELEKMKGSIRPASPRRFPNLTRVPSPRFIRESSSEDDEEYDDSEIDDSELEEESETEPESPKTEPPKAEPSKTEPQKSSKPKASKSKPTETEVSKDKSKPAPKKGGTKLNLLPVAPATKNETVVSIPPPPPLPEVKDESKTSNKNSSKGKKK